MLPDPKDKVDIYNHLADATARLRNGVYDAVESTLEGYQILLRLLMKTGDRASYNLYSAKASALLHNIEKER